ncbi:MAG: hypothetical protein HYS98_06005 [Deltaproteobacteria bacterium]|nr:hypothetical protein [Deltaproteobacteria bacterium]
MGRDWIQFLAKEEVRIEETGELDLYLQTEEKQLLSELTTQFLQDLRREFSDCIKAFNAYRGEQRNTIKIYGIQGTQSDFLVFRNSLKLIVAFERPGTIGFTFNSLQGGVKSGKKLDSDLIEVNLGPFNEGIWKFKNQVVHLQSIVRYYLTEFIRNSMN